MCNSKSYNTWIKNTIFINIYKKKGQVVFWSDLRVFNRWVVENNQTNKFYRIAGITKLAILAVVNVNMWKKKTLFTLISRCVRVFGLDGPNFRGIYTAYFIVTMDILHNSVTFVYYENGVLFLLRTMNEVKEGIFLYSNTTNML